MNALEFRNVKYTYGVGTPFERGALSGVNIAFEEGITTGIIGHTGSGKSTLVQLMNGLLKADEGEVLLFGKNIFENPKNIKSVRFDVGLVFQYPEYQLFEDTVYADIAFGPKNMGLTKEEIDERVKSSCDFVHLPRNILTKSPFELSGGQKRRVAIAGVIAMNPRVLVLDEPTAGLDPMGRHEILSQIKDYRQAKNTTVIIVSHSMEDMAKFADKILVMNESNVFKYGSADEIFEDSAVLTKIGLDVPDAARLAILLKEKGIDLGESIYTVDTLKERIKALISGGDVNA